MNNKLSTKENYFWDNPKPKVLNQLTWSNRVTSFLLKWWLWPLFGLIISSQATNFIALHLNSTCVSLIQFLLYRLRTCSWPQSESALESFLHQPKLLLQQLVCKLSFLPLFKPKNLQAMKLVRRPNEAPRQDPELRSLKYIPRNIPPKHKVLPCPLLYNHNCMQINLLCT